MVLQWVKTHWILFIVLQWVKTHWILFIEIRTKPNALEYNMAI